MPRLDIQLTNLKGGPPSKMETLHNGTVWSHYGVFILILAMTGYQQIKKSDGQLSKKRTLCSGSVQSHYGVLILLVAIN